jgi:anti-anti-sigma factor
MFEFNIVDGNENKIVFFKGTLDTVAAASHQQALLEIFTDNKDIILNLKDLSYISSAGLRILIMLNKSAKAHSVSLRLSEVPEDVSKILEMVGFTKLFEFI